MARRLPLPIQTIYADLVDRCTIAAFDTDYPSNGSFVQVPVKGRVYWYFQQGSKDESGRQPRKYVGPDIPELAERIKKHGTIKSAYRERRQLIAALRQSGLYAPPAETGDVLAAMAAAGVFRLRACVIGTVAYQTYGGLLGVKLADAAVQTGDVDIAQFRSISIAIAEDDRTVPMRDILKSVDPSFRSVAYAQDGRIEATYVNDAQYRVEILTPNRGPNTDTPQDLPALGTHAQPLRFLDYLIYEVVPAVVLHDGGVLVNVPRPERYALHKLIIAQRRREGAAKIDKDLRQAEELLDVLADRRKADLRDAWEEIMDRGPTWRRHVRESLEQLDPKVWKKLAKIVGASAEPQGAPEAAAEASHEPEADTKP
jgi:hypothetical protein